MTARSHNRETGTRGEKLAAVYLEQHGCTIEYLNWKGEGCEIDIIAREGRVWLFVEVKTRTGNAFGWPEKAVNRSKQQHIVRAANAFIYEHAIEEEIRFDIISITTSRQGEDEIYHIKDAFIP